MTEALGIDELSHKDVARFWSKVDRSGDCWPWVGGFFNTGYGAFYIYTRGGRTSAKRAHRVAYTIAFGPIPDGVLVDHMCHNPACVKPDHLRAVTHKQNQENHQGQVRSASGIRNVTWDKGNQRWRVVVRSGRKYHYGGVFKDKQEAAEAARALRLRLHTHNDIDRK